MTREQADIFNNPAVQEHAISMLKLTAMVASIKGASITYVYHNSRFIANFNFMPPK